MVVVLGGFNGWALGVGTPVLKVLATRPPLRSLSEAGCRARSGWSRTDEVGAGDGLDNLLADDVGAVLAVLQAEGVVGVAVVVSAGTSEEGRGGHDSCLHVSGLRHKGMCTYIINMCCGYIMCV